MVDHIPTESLMSYWVTQNGVRRQQASKWWCTCISRMVFPWGNPSLVAEPSVAAWSEEHPSLLNDSILLPCCNIMNTDGICIEGRCPLLVLNYCRSIVTVWVLTVVLYGRSGARLCSLSLCLSMNVSNLDTKAVCPIDLLIYFTRCLVCYLIICTLCKVTETTLILL